MVKYLIRQLLRFPFESEHSSYKIACELSEDSSAKSDQTSKGSL